MAAFAVTFPLVFGWLHFENPAGHNNLYQLFVFGFPAQIFNPDGAVGFLFFNALNFCFYGLRLDGMDDRDVVYERHGRRPHANIL